MHRMCKVAVTCAIMFASPVLARAQDPASAPPATPPPTNPGPSSTVSPLRAVLGVPVLEPAAPTVLPVVPGVTPSTTGSVVTTQAPDQPSGGTDVGAGGDPNESRQRFLQAEEGRPEAAQLGPTPLLKVGILQNLLFGDNADQSKIKVSGWMDFDYTFRSTGPGENNVAPVMNRFGDEALVRELGIYISRALDPKDWSWGFNIIWFAGSDASFIQPTAGWPAQTNPRFGESFTDLNLTAHLPILTDGGVDIKAGRQTTVLGPVGALSWQRPFNSSDYAWYNLEEGRYTGVSANWIINKQLSWYNGVEIGGWGVFFDDPTHGCDYLTQIVYWVDPEAKKTKLWTTVLTGPTGFNMNGNTTVLELGLLQNWNKYIYQIIDSQSCWSKSGLFSEPNPLYRERAYDVYTIVGFHLTPTWDFTYRVEWYKDVDGRDYPGGFGKPHTNYFETTSGLNYHPTKWLEFRPEIRYDYASNPNFGANYNQRNQLTISGDMLLKF